MYGEMCAEVGCASGGDWISYDSVYPRQSMKKELVRYCIGCEL